MSDLRHPCQHWAESISLAAAGCLPPGEEREMLAHVETCSDCRERYRQLVRLCSALADAELPADLAESAVVERVMSAIASDESRQPVANVESETSQPTRRSLSLQKWRWIMRSPVSRVAAAVIFILAVAGVAIWFHGSGATPALADFLQPIREAKGLKYKVTVRMTALSPQVKILPPSAQQELLGKGITREVMMLDATRTRTETKGPIGTEQVEIWDAVQGKSLCLLPAEKRATVFDHANRPDDKAPDRDPLAAFRALLLNAREIPGVERESIGAKEIDGRHVVGIRNTFPAGVMTVWGDPKTGLPVRIEATMAIMPNMKVMMSDFEFNVDMDESLFSVEPPADYEVGSFFIQTPTMGMPRPGSDSSATEEKDLVEMFREYCRLSGGLFPTALDFESIVGIVMVEYTTDRMQKPGAEQEVAEIQAKLQPGLTFRMLLPDDSDAHYAGRGVSLGALDTPVFWYRPEGSKTYRVINADLSVHDADTPPSMPVALPEQDLIDTLRYYSEWSGGPFPDSLKLESLIQGIVMKKCFPEIPQGKWQTPSAEQMQEIQTIAMLKLAPGFGFANSLPPEADAHYAGRGVSFGAADTPIFWYRLQDSKTYRVVYGDLTVRDVDTPPDVAIAPPEQDLIDTLRYYSEWSGGPFPDFLSTEATDPLLARKFSLEDGQEPDAKQTQEIVEITLKFLPGVLFARDLPPEANAHYAGKGVSIGSADTPVFWYRPKDKKTYRIIYGDLSVRDADAPPNVSEAQPIPISSKPKGE